MMLPRLMDLAGLFLTQEFSLSSGLCGPMPTGQCNSSSAGKICAPNTAALDHQHDVYGPGLTPLD